MAALATLGLRRRAAAAGAGARQDGQLTVGWQWVVRQYIEQDVWAATELAFDQSGMGAQGQRPAVWLRMEPGGDQVAGFRLTIKSAADEPEQLLARCGDHGPPVIWERSVEGNAGSTSHAIPNTSS